MLSILKKRASLLLSIFKSSTLKEGVIECNCESTIHFIISKCIRKTPILTEQSSCKECGYCNNKSFSFVEIDSKYLNNDLNRLNEAIIRALPGATNEIKSYCYKCHSREVNIQQQFHDFLFIEVKHTNYVISK